MKKIYIDGEKTTVFSPKVVNNLTDGGTAKALSAEQGKTLKGLIDNIQAGSIDALTDTDISNKADGDVLQYDSTSSKWKNKPTTFTEASSRTNIASGDSLSTIFGKIKKFFSDLKAVAFSGSYGDLSNKPDFSIVALSGDYNDLSNKPPIPAAQVNSDWNASGGVSAILNKPTIPTVPTNISTFNNDANYQNSDGQVKSLKYSGTGDSCFTVHQTSGSFMGRSDWASYMICNHGNGATYYSQTIAMPFWGPPIYRRLEGGTDKGWKAFITDENIASQSVSYATSAGSATSASSATTAQTAGWATSAGSAGYADRLQVSGPFTFCKHILGVSYLTSQNNMVVLETGTSADWKLIQQADGNLVVYQGNTARWSTGTSSRRFKHNIQDMTEERARKILDIRPVTFDWNDDQPVTTRKNDNAGVIAEEVSKIFPDLVVFEDIVDENGNRKTSVERRVEYERFTPYLIKMVQMQQEEIDLLKKRIDILEEKLNER